MTRRLSWVIDAVTAVSEGDADAPSPGISLHATQNPFGSTSAIRFHLDAPARFDLEIVDVAGRIVRRLAENVEGGSGWHSYAWPGQDESGRSVPSGVYFCRLRSANTSTAIRLVLVR
jgi:flagellar hook assembly protein FlgD